MARSPFTMPARRGAAARPVALPAGQLVALSAVLVLVGLIGGGMLSLHWPGRAAPVPQPITRDGDKQIVETTIRNLEAEQAGLKRALAEARGQLDSLQASNAQEKAQLADITSEIDKERGHAGLVPLAGPGVIASFNDSTDAAIPPNEDPANYILHDYNLRDVINTLWAAGAEAISVNGERVLATTSLYCVGTTVICNATRLSPPYEIHAIGAPAALEAALRTAPAMRQFLAHAQIYDETVDIHQADPVAIPAFSGAFGFKYAQPGDAPASTPGPAGH